MHAALLVVRAASPAAQRPAVPRRAREGGVVGGGRLGRRGQAEAGGGDDGARAGDQGALCVDGNGGAGESGCK